jgi:hypothetical protein
MRHVVRCVLLLQSGPPPNMTPSLLWSTAVFHNGFATISRDATSRDILNG